MIHNPEELMAHADFVRGLARSLVQDEHVAADISQDTLVAALKTPEGTVGSISSWFYKVVLNFSRKNLRTEKRRFRREGSVAIPDRTPSTAEIVEREEMRSAVVEAVMNIEEPYRSTLLLRYYEDLPPRKIAQEFQVPLETVKTRLKRALKQLKKKLDDRFDGDRSRWCLALLPVIGVNLKASASAATVGSSSLVTGALVMTTKMKLALILPLLAVGALTWMVFSFSYEEPVVRPEIGDPGSGRPEIAAQLTGDEEEIAAFRDGDALEQKQALEPLTEILQVKGRLLSRVTEQGIPAARVQTLVLPRVQDSSQQQDSSRAMGDFSLTLPMGDPGQTASVSVQVSAPGYRDLTAILPCPRGERSLDFGALYLDEDRIHTLTVLAPDGSPLPGAELCVYWGRKYAVQQRAADPQGKVRVTDRELLLDRVGMRPLYLRIAAPGLADYFGVFFSSRPLPEQVVMEPEGYWEGRITDRVTGTGVPRARLLFKPKIAECPFPDNQPVYTDENGFYRLPRFTYQLSEADEIRQLMLHVSADDYLPVTLYALEETEPLPPERLLLDRAAGMKKVQVFDSASGRVLPGLRLGMGAHEYKVTDANGYFTYPYTEAEPSRFTLFVKGYLYYRYRCDPKENRNGETRAIHLEPSPESRREAVLMVRVKDEAGRAVAGASVELNYTRGTSQQFTTITTDGAGETSFAGFSAWETDPVIKITCRGFCPLETEPLSLRGSGEKQLEFVLERGILLQNLLVVNARGEPLPGRYVHASLFDEQGTRIKDCGRLFVETNSRGLCDLVLPLFHEGYFYITERPDCALRVDLAALLKHQSIVLTITDQVATQALIRGRVVDDTGEPVSRVNLHLYEAKNLYSGDYKLCHFLYTDEQGRFSQPVFRHKPYRLSFMTRFLHGAVYSLEDLEPVRAGTDLVLTMKREEGIHIRLYDLWARVGSAFREYEAWLEDEQGRSIKGVLVRKEKYSLTFLAVPPGRMRAVLLEAKEGRRFRTDWFETRKGESLKTQFKLDG